MEPIRPILPGRFPRLLDTMVHTVALGNMTSMQIFTWMDPKTAETYVGIVGMGFYKFTDYAHAGYVQDKLKLVPGDAGNVADFINSQLCIKWEDWEPQGRYDYPDLVCKIKPGSHVFWTVFGRGSYEVLEFKEAETTGILAVLKPLGSCMGERPTAQLDELELVPISPC